MPFFLSRKAREKATTPPRPYLMQNIGRSMGKTSRFDPIGTFSLRRCPVAFLSVCFEMTASAHFKAWHFSANIGIFHPLPPRLTTATDSEGSCGGCQPSPFFPPLRGHGGSVTSLILGVPLSLSFLSFLLGVQDAAVFLDSQARFKVGSLINWLSPSLRTPGLCRGVRWYVFFFRMVFF